MSERPIYLDYNATTPIDPEVADAMRPCLEGYFGNPSSVHSFGIRAREALERARTQVADLLNCAPDEIIFTSGGTESNNLAIGGIALANRAKGHHIITSSIEHPAVTEVCRYLESKGFRITVLPVDEEGRVDPGQLERALTPETILVTVMHANNEVGTIQPIAEIAAIAAKRGIPVHTDAAQSVGKIPVDVERLGVALLSVAGHKLYAPKGVGALYLRRGVAIEKLMHGAAHERNLRPGTENILEIVGLGKACEIAKRDMVHNQAHMKTMRDRLVRHLREGLTAMRINGHPEHCLPNTLSVGIPGIDASLLPGELQDVALSAGSACHAGERSISPVLKAMKVPPDTARGTLRISTGRMTTEEEIDKAADLILRKISEKRTSP